MKKQEQETFGELNAKLNTVGNLIGEKVPVFADEEHNEVIRKWGEVPDLKVDGKTLGHLHHHEIMSLLDIVEFERGQKVAGHRGYYLKGDGVLLNQALLNFGLTFLRTKKYTPMQPPFFIKESIMKETCQLTDFEESLYKVIG